MPRSAVDATRFTAASPHVYTKPSPVRPSPSSSTYSSLRQPSPSSQSAPNAGNTPPPRNESPQEKVARLRAMRTAQRHAELPLWERTVIRGRRIADRAHRITALSLIGFSVISIGLVGFAVTDMLLHNRRKRDAFYDQQHRIYTSKLLAAIETEKAGISLTNDQQLVLNRERLKVAEEERKKAQSWSNKIRKSLFGGLKEVDESGFGQVDGVQVPLDGGRIPSEGEVLELLGIDKLEMLKDATGKSEADRAEHRERRAVEQDVDLTSGAEITGPVPRKGGILDQMAENAFRRASSR